MSFLKLRGAAVAVAVTAAVLVPLAVATPARAATGPFSCDVPTDFAAPGGQQLVTISEDSATATPVGDPSPVSYNALGFNPSDHYLYAIAVQHSTTPGNELVRIDSGGTALSLGRVTGLPAPASGYAYSGGTFDPSGGLWVFSDDPSDTLAYRIDPELKTVTAQILLDGPLYATDWVFDHGYLWALADTQSGVELARVDPATGAITMHTIGAPTGTYNAAFTLADGTLAFVQAESNQEVRIPLDDTLTTGPVAVTRVDGTVAHAATNDGASCSPAIGIGFSGGAAEVGDSYTGQLQAVGGTEPYTWTLGDTSALPPGLGLKPQTGTISGTPTKDGTFSFTVYVTDSATSSGTASRTVTIHVFPGPFDCTTPTDFVAPDGNAGSQLVTIPEGSMPTATTTGFSSQAYNALAFNPVDRYLYALSLGDSSHAANHLLKIDSGGNVHDLGLIAGLPLPNAGYAYASGAFDSQGTFWVASNDTSTAQPAFGIDVVGKTIVSHLTLDRPFEPIDWTYDYGYLWGLADGTLYQVDVASGHVATVTAPGVPTAAFNADWTFADSTLGFVPTDENTNVVYRIEVTTGPLTAGSIVSTSTFTIGGATPIHGQQNDGASCGPTLQLSAATPDGTYGSPYTGSVQVTGGAAPYHWSIASGSLPPGLSLDPTSGAIDGTPTAAGTYAFTARVTDSSPIAQTTQEPVAITIAGAPLTITASDGSMPYGTTPPIVTPSYDGFLNGDSATTLPTCSTAATSTSEVDQYPTTCTGAVAPNYTITYMPGTMTVTPASQTITFTTTVPTPAAVGGAYTPSATGGGSGNPVTFSVDGTSTPGACSIAASTVSFTAAGQCVIDANQAGNRDYSAAAQAQQVISVGYITAGFLRPVSNAPAVNVGKAGKTYPLKWQLQQANGQFVSSLSAIRSITVASASCTTFNTGTRSDTAVATGGTSLRYDTVTDQYIYNWQTATPGCYSVVVTLDSGQRLTADFNLS